MKERQPQPPSPTALSLWEQRSIEGWENLRCLGKRFELVDQVEVINARLEERQQIRDDDDIDERP